MLVVQFFCFWTIRFETLYATSYHQALYNLQSKPMVPRIWKFKTKTNFISDIFEGSQLVKARDIFDDDLDCQSGFLKLGGRVLKRSSNPAEFYFQRGCKTLGYVFIDRNVFNLQMNFQRHYSVLPTICEVQSWQHWHFLYLWSLTDCVVLTVFTLALLL